MKKLLFLLLILLNLNSYSQTEFNNSFYKRIITVTTYAKRDTSFIDTIYLASNPITFILKGFRMSFLGFDSVSTIRNTTYFLASFITSNNKTNYVKSSLNQIQGYAYAYAASYYYSNTYCDEMKFEMATYLVIKTRVINNSGTPTNKATQYIYYNINGLIL